MQPGQHRETARVILHKPNGQIFLLKTHFDPEVGLPPRWITPGGGIDQGEAPLEAAVRELYEETGIFVEPSALGNQIWQAADRWDWTDGNYNTYVDYFFKLEVEDFVLDDSNWTDDERRDVVEHRWWSITELIDSGELVGPHGLAEFLLSHFHG
jgi:8-oxo-dGTP pyrophosphatase MutT (NUDIX family)